MIIDKAGTPQGFINHRLLLLVWIDAKFQTFSDFQQSHLLLVKIIISYTYIFYGDSSPANDYGAGSRNRTRKASLQN